MKDSFVPSFLKPKD